MRTAIRVLDESQLQEVGGGQQRIICTVTEEYVTCTGNGTTVSVPRTDGGGAGGGTGAGGGGRAPDRGDVGRSGRRW
jgi:hypothetical protein